MSEYHLSVVQPFAGYAAGDRITAPEEIKAVMETEQAQHVVRVAVPAASVEEHAA